MQQMITQGIVVRSVDYFDNDKLITIITPDHGRVSARLRGVKKPTAKMKFASQPFCYAQFKLVGMGDIKVVAGASEIENFFEIASDYDKMLAGSVVLEMADTVGIIDQADHLLFRGLVQAIKTLIDADIEPYLIVMRFAIGVFKITGYNLNLTTCGHCGKNYNKDLIKLDVDTGEFVCTDCTPSRFVPISPRAFEILQQISKLHFDELTGIVLTEQEIVDFKHIIKAKFDLHFGRDLQSLKK